MLRGGEIYSRWQSVRAPQSHLFVLPPIFFHSTKPPFPHSLFLSCSSMADFSFLSDTDESAVEEILAEAADHVALKQISALNLSGVSDSVLPQHLESRFRRLKSLPTSLPRQPPPPPPASAESPPQHKPSLESAPNFTDLTHNEVASTSGNPKSKSRSRSSQRRRSRSPSPSPSSSSGSSTSWLEPKSSPKLKPEKEFGSNRRPGSVSPPAKKIGSGGLWRSLKSALKKMSFTKRSGRRRRGESVGLDWAVNDSVLDGIGVGSLSRKEQEKILKRAAKEEMKISQEAEKIAKLAKHVSARMEAFGVDYDDDLHYK